MLGRLLWNITRCAKASLMANRSQLGIIGAIRETFPHGRDPHRPLTPGGIDDCFRDNFRQAHCPSRNT